MADTNYDYTMEIDPGETPSVYSRVTNPAGTAYTQSGLSTISYKLIKLSDESTVTGPTALTISSVVYNTMQAWPEDSSPDSTGYNFLHRPSAAHVADENEQYEARYTFTDTSSIVSLLRVLIKTGSLPG